MASVDMQFCGEGPGDHVSLAVTAQACIYLFCVEDGHAGCHTALGGPLSGTLNLPNGFEMFQLLWRVSHLGDLLCPQQLNTGVEQSLVLTYF